MRGARSLAALLIVLGAFVLALPAAALAGGSAGNNQYTNPFGSTTSSQPPATSSTASAPPATTTAAAPPQTSTSPDTGTTPATAPAQTATDSGAPTATATTTGPSLPRTGYGEWEAAGFGLVMIAGGLVIRRRAKRS